MSTERNTLVTAPYGPLEETRNPGLLRLARAWMVRAGRAYLDWRLRRATVRILQSLNNRALADIGMSRSEIHSVVYGEKRERTRRFRPTWE